MIGFHFDSHFNLLQFIQQMLTEWQQYLTQCIETIALVAEVRPLQVFEQVVSVTHLQAELIFFLNSFFHWNFSTANGVVHSKFSNRWKSRSIKMAL